MEDFDTENADELGDELETADAEDVVVAERPVVHEVDDDLV